jgi:Leucine-rich repeat (LRR) protein
LTDEGIQGLERIPCLEDLQLSETTVSSVSHLSACKRLRTLNLEGCVRLTHSGIVGLEFIPTLENVNLSRTNLTDISHFSTCRALKTLNLFDCANITDTSLSGIDTIPSLTELNLEKTKITDASKWLLRCVALKILNLRDCRQLGDGSLGVLPLLEELDITGTRITNVSFLSACKSLKKLYAFGSDLTDDGIRGLEQIPTLVDVEFEMTKVTNPTLNPRPRK